MGDLLFFALCEAVIRPSEFKDVLGELTSHFRSTLRILLCSIKPKVKLFKHFMDTGTVLKDEHLFKCRHLERRYTAIFLALLRVDHWLAKRTK